jgi:hypothetical protein
VAEWLCEPGSFRPRRLQAHFFENRTRFGGGEIGNDPPGEIGVTGSGGDGGSERRQPLHLGGKLADEGHSWNRQELGDLLEANLRSTLRQTVFALICLISPRIDRLKLRPRPVSFLYMSAHFAYTEWRALAA